MADPHVRFDESTRRPTSLMSRLTSVFRKNDAGNLPAPTPRPVNPNAIRHVSFIEGLQDFLGSAGRQSIYDPPSPSSPTSPRISRHIPFVLGLQAQLDTAVLAEAPTESYLVEENEFPHVRALKTDGEIGDGLWICCHCRYENILRHWRGPYPFKYLRCTRCKRKICSECRTSEILTPWANGLIYARPPAAGQELRYCHVCSDCGLSHRAEMAGDVLDFHSAICADCGSSSWGGNWLRFYIGDVETYRRDPDETFAQLVDARANHAVEMASRREMDEVESRPESKLSCRNTG